MPSYKIYLITKQMQRKQKLTLPRRIFNRLSLWVLFVLVFNFNASTTWWFPCDVRRSQELASSSKFKNSYLLVSSARDLTKEAELSSSYSSLSAALPHLMTLQIPPHPARKYISYVLRQSSISFYLIALLTDLLQSHILQIPCITIFFQFLQLTIITDKLSFSPTFFLLFLLQLIARLKLLFTLFVLEIFKGLFFPCTWKLVQERTRMIAGNAPLPLSPSRTAFHTSSLTLRGASPYAFDFSRSSNSAWIDFSMCAALRAFNSRVRSLRSLFWEMGTNFVLKPSLNIIRMIHEDDVHILRA